MIFQLNRVEMSPVQLQFLEPFNPTGQSKLTLKKLLYLGCIREYTGGERGKEWLSERNDGFGMMPQLAATNDGQLSVRS